MTLHLYWHSTPHCACLIGNIIENVHCMITQLISQTQSCKQQLILVTLNVGPWEDTLKSYSVRPEVLEELMDGGEGVSELS